MTTRHARDRAGGEAIGERESFELGNLDGIAARSGYEVGRLPNVHADRAVMGSHDGSSLRQPIRPLLLESSLGSEREQR